MHTTGNPPPKTPGFGTLQAMGCRDQMFTKAFCYIKRIEPSRVEIVYVETGVRLPRRPHLQNPRRRNPPDRTLGVSMPCNSPPAANHKPDFAPR